MIKWGLTFGAYIIPLSMTLAACGKSETPRTEQEARDMLMGGLSAPQKEIGGGPVRYDVVGIRPAMGASEVVKQLTKDGWQQQDQRLTLVELPGLASYEAPEMQVWLREGQEGDAWKSEILAVHYSPALPKQDAQVYLLIFDRRFSDQAYNIQNRIALSRGITADFSIATLAALKSKYGEPPKFDESACVSRGAGSQPQKSIPIYEINYPMGSANPKALNAKVGQDCRQSLAIRIEDSMLARTQRQKLEELRAAKTAEATKAKPGAKTDF